MEIIKEPGMQRLLQQMDSIYTQMPWAAFPSHHIHPGIRGDNSGGKDTRRKWGAVGRTLFQERIPNPVLFFPFGKQWCCFLHSFSSRRQLSILTVVQEQYRVDLSTPECRPQMPAIQGSDPPQEERMREVGCHAELNEPGE